MSKYTVDGAFFENIEDKQIWLLNGIIHNLEYIGKSSTLTHSEDAIKKLSIRQIKKVIKSIDKYRK